MSLPSQRNTSPRLRRRNQNTMRVKFQPWSQRYHTQLWLLLPKRRHRQRRPAKSPKLSNLMWQDLQQRIHCLPTFPAPHKHRPSVRELEKKTPQLVQRSRRRQRSHHSQQRWHQPRTRNRLHHHHMANNLILLTPRMNTTRRKSLDPAPVAMLARSTCRHSRYPATILAISASALEATSSACSNLARHQFLAVTRSPSLASVVHATSVRCPWPLCSTLRQAQQPQAPHCHHIS